MSKRLAIFAVVSVLASILAAANPAQADPPTPAVATGAATVAGCLSSCTAVVGVFGGENAAGWCVDVATLCTVTGGASHEWHASGAGTGSLSGDALGGGTLSISVGGVGLDFAVGTGGVILGVVDANGNTSEVVGFVDYTTGSGAVAIAG